LVLTMVRKSQLIEARWSEFNLASAVWNVPAARNREEAPPAVHLSRQAVAMLDELRQGRTSKTFVFPTVRGFDRPIAHSTLNQAVKALGLEVEHFVLHDFRRTASAHVRVIKEAAGRVTTDDRADDAKAAVGGIEAPQRWADFVEMQIGTGGVG
jgi:integrase